MNISTDHSHNRLCEFIEEAPFHYICIKCGNQVFSEDGAPPVVCSIPWSSNQAPVTMAQKAKNFILAAADHLGNGAKLCTEEQVEHRYTICSTCEFFQNNACNKCGCPIVRNRQFISKLSWTSSECPVGKWKAEQ